MHESGANPTIGRVFLEQHMGPLFRQPFAHVVQNDGARAGPHRPSRPRGCGRAGAGTCLHSQLHGTAWHPHHLGMPPPALSPPPPSPPPPSRCTAEVSGSLIRWTEDWSIPVNICGVRGPPIKCCMPIWFWPTFHDDSRSRLPAVVDVPGHQNERLRSRAPSPPQQ